MKMTETRDLTLDDFFTGLLAALAGKGIALMPIKGEPFYRAIEASYRALEDLSDEYQVDPRFAVFIDPIHRDSAVVMEAVGSAVLRDLAVVDGPEFQELRIKLRRDQAENLLGQLPGGVPLFAAISEVFLRAAHCIPA